MLNQEDLKLLEAKGITPEMLEQQINRFKSGFPYLKVKSVATVGDGILRLTEDDINRYINLWNNRLAEGCKVVKFVPASGAASRMFKNLFEFVSSGRQTPETDFEKKFFAGIKNFAFYEALNEACIKKHGKDIDALMNENGSTPFVWRDCFRREFLNQHQILFNETVRYGEDIIFQFEAFPHAASIIFISDKLYHYRWSRAGSLMV